MEKELKKQYLNDETMQNEVYQINLDFTLLEQLKLAKNIIDLVHGDIIYNTENNNDIKTCNTLTTITLQLKEIIEQYEVKQ